jgi:hypothetical protein
MNEYYVTKRVANLQDLAAKYMSYRISLIHLILSFHKFFFLFRKVNKLIQGFLVNMTEFL